MTEEASIPILRLWEILAVPLQGDVSDAQADRLTDRVLDIVQVGSARALLIDLSGVSVVDSHLLLLPAGTQGQEPT